jgi:hypothetical protein
VSARGGGFLPDFFTGAEKSRLGTGANNPLPDAIVREALVLRLRLRVGGAARSSAQDHEALLAGRDLPTLTFSLCLLDRKTHPTLSCLDSGQTILLAARALHLRPLRAAKARGTRLGNPALAKAAKRGTAAVRANARQFAANALPIIREIERAGARSLNAIAAKLNERNVQTARGGRWIHVQVRAVLARA